MKHQSTKILPVKHHSHCSFILSCPLETSRLIDSLLCLCFRSYLRLLRLLPIATNSAVKERRDEWNLDGSFRRVDGEGVRFQYLYCELLLFKCTPLVSVHCRNTVFEGGKVEEILKLIFQKLHFYFKLMNRKLDCDLCRNKASNI